MSYGLVRLPDGPKMEWFETDWPTVGTWTLTHGTDQYQLIPKDALTIVCMKNGFFEARFVGRGMELAKEYTEKFIVDAPPEQGE